MAGRRPVIKDNVLKKKGRATDTRCRAGEQDRHTNKHRPRSGHREGYVAPNRRGRSYKDNRNVCQGAARPRWPPTEKTRSGTATGKQRRSQEEDPPDSIESFDHPAAAVPSSSSDRGTLEQDLAAVMTCPSKSADEVALSAQDAAPTQLDSESETETVHKIESDDEADDEADAAPHHSPDDRKPRPVSEKQSGRRKTRGRPRADTTPASEEWKNGQYNERSFPIPIALLRSMINVQVCVECIEWMNGENNPHAGALILFFNILMNAIEFGADEDVFDVKTWTKLPVGRRLVAWPSFVHVSRAFRSCLALNLGRRILDIDLSAAHIQIVIWIATATTEVSIPWLLKLKDSIDEVKEALMNMMMSDMTTMANKKKYAKTFLLSLINGGTYAGDHTTCPCLDELVFTCPSFRLSVIGSFTCGSPCWPLVARFSIQLGFLIT